MTFNSSRQIFPTLRQWLLLLLLVSKLSWAAHPLISDDTETLGLSVSEVEISLDVARSESSGLLLSKSRTRVPTASTLSKTTLLNATITRGLAERLDVSLSLPYERTKDEEKIVKGINDVALELKWRVVSGNNFSLAIKPQVFAATGSVQQDLGNGKTSYGLVAIGAHKTTYFTILGNVGYIRNRNLVGAREKLWIASTGVLWQPAPRWQLVADFGVYRNPDLDESQNPKVIILGVIFSPNNKLDLDFGIRKGLNPSEVNRGAGIGLSARW